MARLLRRRAVPLAVACGVVLAVGCSEQPTDHTFPSAGYDPTADPAADLQEARAEADRSGRRILMEVGGDWCIWCHHWERFLTENDDIRRVLVQNFVVLKVNHGPRNTNEEFLAQYPEIPGYPHFFVLEASGDLVLSQGTEVLEHGPDSYDRQKVLDFLQQWD